MNDDLRALVPLLDLFETLGIEHYVGGSIASSVHGVARTTLDVHVVASLDPSHVEAIARGLAEDYYVEATQIRHALEHERAFNVIHTATMYKVDVFPMKRRDFDQAARRRAVARRLDPDLDRVFAIASPEDTVLNKLEWFRAGEEISERQ